MTKILRHRFSHPEPLQERLRLLPVFLPFAGCPSRCVFCDQHAQTGLENIRLEDALGDLRERLAREEGRSFGLGFFGGTFTGLGRVWQERFLGLAADFTGPGGLVHLRVSTRPDRVDPESLRWLRASGVSMIELGVQTFSSSVLEASGRGYDGAVAERACAMVREAGLELGIQLLPGLPGHDAPLWREDVRKALALAPDVVRIYPCVVVRGTGLADMLLRGEYAPWPLDVAVEESGRALLEFWKAGVRVIRLGLAGEPGLLERLVAGPWHPAFGNMARSLALRLLLEERLAGLTGRVTKIFLPSRLGGELWGHGRVNAEALARLGIVRENVNFWSETDIALELEEQ
ncbi:MAG: radical SAM protein [Deltaproteobacteria bacterium HGW-Deltaproteobacteria-18]|nr:MAG: radical SAM protein [Deltaproteobacteria bacterium HGW-Deltaproteobacteria-18]